MGDICLKLKGCTRTTASIMKIYNNNKQLFLQQINTIYTYCSCCTLHCSSQDKNTEFICNKTYFCCINQVKCIMHIVYKLKI